MSSRNYDLNALMKAAAIGMVVMLVVAVLSKIDCVRCFAFCGTVFVLAGTGWLYGSLARQNGVRADTVSTALFGGLAAALAAAIPALLWIGIETSILCAPFFLFIPLIPVFVFGAVGGTLYAMMND